MEMADAVGIVDGIPIYYGGDFWDSECDDIGYTGNFDGQSESSDYEDPHDFYRNEWLDSCGFHAPDGFYEFFPEDGEAQLPVSKCMPGTAVEEMATPVRLQQDSWGTSVSAVDIDPRPVMDFLGPPVVGVPQRWRILGFRTFRSTPRRILTPGQ